jgi:hypothetical protein
MTCQLPTDCLSDILKHLDRRTLRSCLLVNRLWCEISVRIYGGTYGTPKDACLSLRRLLLAHYLLAFQ